MFGRHTQTDSLNGGISHTWTWPRSERARQRDRERADAEMVSEVHWQWRSACATTPLAPIIYTPSGATRAVPVIVHVDLGPPIALIVKVRPGQAVADFTAAAPTIAAALDVAELEVTRVGLRWVRIVLVGRAEPDGPVGEAWRFGA